MPDRETLEALEAAVSDTCRDCGEVFVITETEAAWFRRRELQLPRRCAPCRKKKKAEREGRVALEDWRDDRHTRRRTATR